MYNHALYNLGLPKVGIICIINQESCVLICINCTYHIWYVVTIQQVSWVLHYISDNPSQASSVIWLQCHCKFTEQACLMEAEA